MILIVSIIALFIAGITGWIVGNLAGGVDEPVPTVPAVVEAASPTVAVEPLSSPEPEILATPDIAGTGSRQGQE